MEYPDVPKFISSQRIQLAMQRLAESRAQSRMCEWLIIKRGLHLTEGQPMNLGQNDPVLNQAINEMMGTRLDTATEKPRIQKKYVNVFGITQGDDGYRSDKFPSNGIGTTVMGGPWRSIVVVSGEDPRTIVTAEFQADELKKALLKSNLKLLKPRLDDLACWIFRGADIEEFVSDDAPLPNRLSQKVKEDYGITDEEANVLFAELPQQENTPA